MKRINLPFLTIAVLFAFIGSVGAGQLAIAIVPVPEGGATFVLLAIALTGLAALRRKTG